MEDTQVQNFIYRLLGSKELLRDFVTNPMEVASREQLSPRVSQVAQLMIPNLAAYGEKKDSPIKVRLDCWWTWSPC